MTPRVKICGLTTENALAAACEAGADFIGLVFFPKSPRHISLDRARALRSACPSGSAAKVVALVVDPDDAALGDIVREVCPDYLQLHGHETRQRVEDVRKRWGLPIIKAIPVASAADVEAGLSYLDPGTCADIVLFDAKPAPGGVLPGGNGLAFDWHILARLRGREAFALAGGLTPENVADAIRLTGAAIVDVSSGVERAPGVKDPGLIRHFLRNAKAAKQGPTD